jgi:hypothetical protein
MQFQRFFNWKTTRYSSLILVAALSLISKQTNAQWKPVEGTLTTDWTSKVTPENVWQEYPRPQLIRQKWMNLNGLWEYAIRPKDEEKPAQFDGKILVPFAVESALSGVGKQVGDQNKLWYRRTFEVPENWNSERLILRFDAVDWELKVWVNGKYVDSHTGGYDNSAYNIAPYLNKEGLQEIVVSVYDPVDAGTQPRGKQVKNPNTIWYTSVTGIWQTVWLEPLAKENIETLRITPNIDVDSIHIKVTCVNDNKQMSYEALVFDNQKLVCKGASSTLKALKLYVADAKLWSPDSPFLYDMVVLLRDKNGKTVDSLKTYFGMRKISLGKDEKGITRIMLNNKFVFQHGLLDQGWWPDGLYTAPTDEALRYDIEMTKKMGFNLARKHVKVEPSRWYYWCDKLGLLVWQDMPSGDAYINPDGQDTTRTKESGQQFMKELEEIMREKFNHPSIVVWVPFNEGWGQWKSIIVGQVIKLNDPSRLVNVASGWADRKSGDIHDIHAYPGPEMPAPEAYRAIVLGEYGGLGLPLEGHTWQKMNNWGYKNISNQADLADAYSELTSKLLALKEKGLSAAVYTQTTDVEGEVNGMMTYDRRVSKIAPETLTRINAGYLPPKFIADTNTFIKEFMLSIQNQSSSGEIRYTINGKDPEKKSKLYKTPVKLKKTTEVKARIYWPDGTFSKVSTATFRKLP